MTDDTAAAVEAALRRQREHLRVSRVLQRANGDYVAIPIEKVWLSGEGFDVVIGPTPPPALPKTIEEFVLSTPPGSEARKDWITMLEDAGGTLPVCSECGQRGHYRDECPTRKPEL